MSMGIERKDRWCRVSRSEDLEGGPWLNEFGFVVASLAVETVESPRFQLNNKMWCRNVKLR